MILFRAREELNDTERFAKGMTFGLAMVAALVALFAVALAILT